jgi:hypothetical protein
MRSISSDENGKALNAEFSGTGDDTCSYLSSALISGNFILVVDKALTCLQQAIA